MENLIKRLQEEAGLTEEQSMKAIAVIKDFMDNEGMSVDWNTFFKGKYEEFTEKTKSFVKETVRKADSLSDKISDKAEDVVTEVRRTARDLSKRVYDSLSDD